MTFPDHLRNLISWLDQPMPDRLSDMHTVVFRLERQVDDFRLAFNGQLLFVPIGAGADANHQVDRLRGGGYQTHVDLLDTPEATSARALRTGNWVQFVIDLSDSGLVTASFESRLTDSPEGAAQPLDFRSEPKIVFADAGGVVLALDGGWWLLLRPSTGAPSA